MTFCPHCEVLLRGRTFRNHKHSYYDPVNKHWEKDASLLDSSSASGDESEREDNNDNVRENDNSTANECYDCNLLNLDDGEDIWEHSYHEVWDDIVLNDVDADFTEDLQPAPSIELEVNETDSNSLQRSLIRWLLIILLFFSTCFSISDKAMEFLLSFLKKVFDVISLTNNWMTSMSKLFPGSLYLF